MTQVDHLASLILKYSTNNVDRRIMPIKKRGSRYKSYGVSGL
jgi:hypothetical protein